MTQRGTLSIVSSINGPLGFVAPFVLKGKGLTKRLCQDEIDWDERVNDSNIYQRIANMTKEPERLRWA